MFQKLNLLKFIFNQHIKLSFLIYANLTIGDFMNKVSVQIQSLVGVSIKIIIIFTLKDIILPMASFLSIYANPNSITISPVIRPFTFISAYFTLAYSKPVSFIINPLTYIAPGLRLKNPLSANLVHFPVSFISVPIG